MKQNEISELEIERYVLGEVNEAVRAKIEELARHDKLIRDRLLQIREENRKFADEFPFANTRLVSNVLKPHRQRSRRFSSGLAVSAIATITAVAVGISILMPNNEKSSLKAHDYSETVRLKGLQPQLHLYKKTAHGALPLVNGSHVDAHDTIQISYLAAGLQYGVILSVDGRGSVSLHFPSDKTKDSLLQSSGEIALPYAFQLDDAPRYERFFFIASDSPIDATTVVDHAEAWIRNSRNPLSDSFHFSDGTKESTVTLFKPG